jgi:predicted ATPase
MITKIKINNFKSIRQMDMPLHPINVLIGANGAGKSNFIHFFKLANRIYEQRLQDHIGNNIDALLYFGRKKSEQMSGSLEFFQDDPKYKNAFQFVVKPKSQGNSGYISETADLFNRGTDDHDHATWDLKKWDSNTDESNIRNAMAWRAEYIKQYLGSFKIYHFHDTSNASALKGPSLLNDNRFLAEDGRNLAAYLYLLQQQYPKAFQKIEMQVRAIAPFFDHFDLAPDQLNKAQIELQWLDRGSDIPFNAYHLSDGTLRFIALATLLLQPNLPKTIIIDEPELGLHPAAINKLAGLIMKASAQSQIIISTQSVGLVDNFEPADIITVDRQDNQSVFHRHQKADLVHWLDTYSMGDLWNKNVIGGRP